MGGTLLYISDLVTRAFRDKKQDFYTFIAAAH